jgi:hypothetical protein
MSHRDHYDRSHSHALENTLGESSRAPGNCAHFMTDADHFQGTSNDNRSSGRSGNAPRPQQWSAQRSQVAGITYSIQQFSDGTIHTQITREYSAGSFPGETPMGALPDFPGYQPYAMPESSRSRPSQSRHADLTRPRPRTPPLREPVPATKPRWTPEEFAALECMVATRSSQPQITAGSPTRADSPRDAQPSQTQSKSDLHLPNNETFIHKPSSQNPRSGRRGRGNRTRPHTSNLYTSTDDYSTSLVSRRLPTPGRILGPVEDDKENNGLYALLSPPRDSTSAPNAKDEDPEVVDSADETEGGVPLDWVYEITDGCKLVPA